ncbi:hypothetical protein VTN77DRAFT_6756 [Rasamsonia byssochlamydoides]|uniref:uncharacterized protein n=1 Tax=Rasamsonia byssochlamydoides TaxID=89139 RepID=UPI003744233F
MGLPCPLSLPPVAPFLFSVLVVSSLSAKVLHIAQHVHSLPLLHLIIYLPTLFFLDLLVICLGRLLLRGPESPLQMLTCVLGGLMALVTYGASAIEFGFFFETGSEVEWGATGSFVRDPAAMKLLMSGIRSVTVAGAVLFVISWMLTPYLHTITGNCLCAVRNWVCEGIRSSRTLLPLARSPAPRRNIRVLIPAILIATSLLLIRATRPAVPYDHLSGTLPFSLSEAFHKSSSTACLKRHPPPFPFPELISEEYWEEPHGNFPGWAPDPQSRHKMNVKRPDWLPEHPPPGFQRWTVKSEEGNRDKKGEEDQCHFPHQTYNPVTDPLKISNLDLDILHPLRQVFEANSVEINHVVLLSLESARKEVFPMQPGTYLYDTILESHTEDERDKIVDKLSVLTPVAQMVTGEYALTSKGTRNNFSDAVWQDHAAEGMGGINVKGAVTGSTLTFKSMLGSHCGVNPLPVDLIEEVKLDFYQPCLPHILELFNQEKKNTSRADDAEPVPFQERPWKSVFMQSVTETYDRQRELNRKLGFQQTIVKETIDRSSAKYYPPKTKEINYFGYAESEIEPYLRDVIFEAAKNETRLFLSHITSTTHHPWNVPDSFRTQTYMGLNSGLRSRHQDLNNYLNAVAYVDEWLGKILRYIDEAGIADSTLVVMIGDHGQAFVEDTAVTGTFENGHISNFRVPIVFRHPRLPRIDISANATSLAIIPTLLDLFVQTRSLNEADTRIASSLMYEYQGQSLLRPFRSEYHGRRVWNVGVINAGGSMLSVSTAGIPFRLVMPLHNESGEGGKLFQYRFTHTDQDPAERHPLEAWTLKSLRRMVLETYGREAADWLDDAGRLGKWWVAEQKRVWNWKGG